MAYLVLHASIMFVLPESHCCFFFFFNDTATTEIYTLSLHDALPISRQRERRRHRPRPSDRRLGRARRSEEHTSELQSQFHLVCRLLLEKKKTKKKNNTYSIKQQSNKCTITPPRYSLTAYSTQSILPR